MVLYDGIISGIGDKQNLINVIGPQFDAKVYKYIIGREEGIISGLILSENKLSSGICFAQGYRGEIPQDINLPQRTGYVYGRFVVNHQKNVPDSFSIAYSESRITYTNDDILHEAGTYYLLLFINGTAQLPTINLCPYKAETSVYTRRVLENGTLGSGVTCPTPRLDSNNKVVANTEYVHNEIEAKIGYDTLALGEPSVPLANAIVLKRKAKYVIGRVYLIVDGRTYESGQPIYALPVGWRPLEKLNLGDKGYLSTLPGRWTVYIDTDGKIYGEQTTDNTTSTLVNLANFGYEAS